MEVTVPIVYGSISFWLGKKAAEYVFPPLSRFYTSHTCANLGNFLALGLAEIK